MMKEKNALKQLKNEIASFRAVDKAWFLSLLDDEQQKVYEENHLRVLLIMLRYYYLSKERAAIKKAQEELAQIRAGETYSANDYARTLKLNAVISAAYLKMESYKHFFDEPYFARMDVQDDKEGYNVYYIGKKGDLNLGVVDWRAPLARRYYQKSRRYFSINEYDYTVILRRAIRTHAGKIADFKNEHLSVRDYLTKEEINGRDEEIILDPYLRELIRARKNEAGVKDIIESIQEKQFDLITRPERENFVLQGCAGSGKTMVLLHRLSYLMYNNDQLSSRDVLVITPSKSFNSFIDELAQSLELEKVRTSTLQDYFLQVLSKAGVDVSDKINGKKENEEYLAYLYSDQFVNQTQKALLKTFDDVYGLFASQECLDFSNQILSDCLAQKEAYTHIKNTSVRVRRTVLGEIKEDAEGNPRYTKPFRDFMNDVFQIEDFLRFGLKEDVNKSQGYFYRQLSSFYKSAAHVVYNAERVVEEGLRSLAQLEETLEKEIKDLKRYRIYVGGKEEYTYTERIAARLEILKEAQTVKDDILTIGEHCGRFVEFFRVLQGQKSLSELGKCENTLELARFFYRLVVKKQKTKFGMNEKGLYPSDAYALLTILSALGHALYPHYSLVFVDEGQDISAAEYALLRKINSGAAFNVYGDLKQNVTPWRGVNDWQQALPGAAVYSLNQNYRNTNQIVDFVRAFMDADMHSIGFDGASVQNISLRQVSAFLKDRQGIKAVIACENQLPMLKRTAYNVVGETGVLSKKKINLLTVYESKGLEFSAVAVYDKGMSENQRYIAYTRALDFLAVIREEEDKKSAGNLTTNKKVSKAKAKKSSACAVNNKSFGGGGKRKGKGKEK